MLVDCDYTGWNSLKIILQLDSVVSSISADLNIMDLLQSKHPKILDGIGVGLEKVAFSIQKL